MSHHLYAHFLESLPIFKGLGSELMTHICRLVFTVKVLKEQVIYEEGTVGSEMCIAGMRTQEVQGGGPPPWYPPCGRFAAPQPDDSYPLPIAPACDLMAVTYRRPP